MIRTVCGGFNTFSCNTSELSFICGYSMYFFTQLPRCFKSWTHVAVFCALRVVYIYLTLTHDSSQDPVLLSAIENSRSSVIICFSFIYFLLLIYLLVNAPLDKFLRWLHSLRRNHTLAQRARSIRLWRSPQPFRSQKSTESGVCNRYTHRIIRKFMLIEH